jgi:tellurite methyltransferase
MTTQELNRELGNVDIYLLDQILKGRYHTGMKILDAGCGEGRNLIYFLNNGFDVHGIDQNPEAIRLLRFIIGSKYPYCSKENFNIGPVESMDFANESFDLIISSAVLHFANSHDQFKTMFAEMIRVLRSTGQLFIRMTSNIGLNISKEKEDTGCFFLPDGSLRYLITRELIIELLREYNLELIEPIKTANVDYLRCMTTLVLSKKYCHLLH